MLRRKTKTTPDTPQPAAPKPATTTANAHTGPTAHLTRLLTIGFFTLVILGALTGPIAVALVTTIPTPQTEQTKDDDQATTTAAGQYALAYLTAWLTATEKDHSQLDTYASSGTYKLPAEPRQYRDPAVVTSIDAGAGIHTVQLAATVKETVTVNGKTATTWPRRYFQTAVAVSADGAGFSPIGYPAPIAGPSNVETPTALNYPAQLQTTTPVGTTLTDFFTAYLAGKGDLTRFITPGSPIRPVDPALPTTPVLLDLRADKAPAAQPADKAIIQILATVEHRPAPGAAGQASTYALTLTARADRWEITSINPSPKTVQTNNQGEKP
jgi:Conjugative transposon protein TcpC